MAEETTGNRGTAPAPARKGLFARLRQRTFIHSTWAYFLLVVLFDSAICALAMEAAVRWRYDFLNTPMPYLIEEKALLITFATCLVVWSVSRIPRAVWRFVSLDDVRKLAMAVAAAMILVPLLMFLFVNRGVDFPRSAPLFAGPLAFIILLFSRLVVVVVRNGDIKAVFSRPERGRPNVVLAGSPTALYSNVRDMHRRRGGASLNVLGLIDMEEDTAGRSIRGVPVIGSIDSLPRVYPALAAKYDDPPQIIAVDRRPDRARAAELVRMAAELGAPLSRISESGVRGELTPFEAQDLIGRAPRVLDIAPVRRLVEGRSVLVTGAGGSIGSELARQIARLGPSRLTLVDHSEYNLYRIDRQLADLAPDVPRVPRIGSVTDPVRMDEVFDESAPSIVLHAAALKHVPMGEANPLETLHTNVEGTRVLLELCVAHGVESFTLVSTDKAVNTHNVMGASKCVAERLTHAFDTAHEGLSACAVRFGNVLASAGSVIPLFDEQIERGGPVTVTDPQAARYFMTTQEASALVLQATALDSTQRKDGSSVYVLEMGEPVNIDQLARQLIRLRGKIPGRDIAITYSGLRPGETLDERIVGAGEELESTYVDGLQRISGTGVEAGFAPEQVTALADALIAAVGARDMAGVRRALARLLPGVRMPDCLVDRAAGSDPIPLRSHMARPHAGDRPS